MVPVMTDQQLADELFAVWRAARDAGADTLTANEKVNDRAKELDEARDLAIIKQCIGRKL